MSGIIPAYVEAVHTTGYHTELAGTVITEAIPGLNGARLALIHALVTAAATAHTLSIMHTGGNAGQRSKTTAGAAAAQKDIVVDDAMTDGAGNAIAANDIVAYQIADGSWTFDTAAGWVAGTKTLTLTANIPTGGILSGGRVVNFGVVGDGILYKLSIPASAQKEFGPGLVVVAPYAGDPLYVSDNNAAAAGSIDNLLFGYINI